MDFHTDLNTYHFDPISDALRYSDIFNSNPEKNRTEFEKKYAVLGAEVQRLRAKLNTIAFPRRGSPEAGWGVDEIGRFAAEGLEPSQAGVNKDATTVRQASPAELRAAYNSGAADHSQLSGVLISDYVGKLLEGEARRRYPDTAGEESRRATVREWDHKLIFDFLTELNQIATSANEFVFGLPINHPAPMDKMITATRFFLTEIMESAK